MTFKLILSAITPELYEAFKNRFAKFPDVEIISADFTSAFDRVDCIVSAANSFGLMDGGSDLFITKYFGEHLQKRVQGKIILDYWGEQPVGTSFVMRGNKDLVAGQKNKYVAHTPTMRVPGNISKADNVYRAMKAMLIAVEQHNRERVLLQEAGVEDEDTVISSVVCPGLGTGVGEVLPEEAAKMMALALTHFRNPPKQINWFFATQRHGEIVDREIEDNPNEIDLAGFDNLVDLPPVPDYLPPIATLPNVDDIGIELPPDAPTQ